MCLFDPLTFWREYKSMKSVNNLRSYLYILPITRRVWNNLNEELNQDEEAKNADRNAAILNGEQR
jgi:hypothetical protein